ncbi:Membrane protein involved in the export of O-antigen and teichoic acid [Halopenitus persicus]|uniref:Membrane protein involved in the export of O-antigen and teichoic acid n=2 Tax=Halopenitus persicus TaxID=1048396 RepID=A0A1H3MD91_9EURY|nr:Membrane protein involved in the export of O-antigen and teichoic acid [Halopenitus persicus]
MLFQSLGLVYFAQELGAEKLGVFILFQTCLTLLSLAADFGVDDAIEKRISEQNHSATLGSALLLKSSFLIFISILIILFSNNINDYIGQPLSHFLLIALIPNQLRIIIMRTLEGELKVQRAANVSLIQNVLFVLIGASFVYFNFGVRGLVYSIIMSNLISVTFGVFGIDTELGMPSKAMLKSLVKFGSHNFIASIVHTSVYDWLDTLLIGLFLTQSHVAAYEVAWKVASMIMLLSSAIADTIFPQISHWDAQGNRESIQNILPNTLITSLVIVFPAIVGGVIYGREILHFIFGSEFAIANTALVILLLGKIPEGIDRILGRFLLAIDESKLASYAAGLFIILNIPLNIILINVIGITGAAIATVTSYSANTALTAYYLNSFIDLRINITQLIITLVSSACMGVLLLILNTIIYINSQIKLIFAIFLGAVIYFTFLLSSSTMREQVLSNVDDLIPFM